MTQGWTMPVRQAKYGGVEFEVFNIDDTFERAIVKHGYPFVNGEDIEAMGLNALTVHLSAVFYGQGYYSEFKRFLKVLEANKPSTLMHPIRGRLPNMLCTSANFHHDAEFVDYVTVELNFIECGEPQPIFLFENSLLAKLDKLFADIDAYLDNLMDIYADFMEGVSAVLAAKDKIVGMWGALYSTYRQILSVFGKKKSHSISASISATHSMSASLNVIKELINVIDEGLTELASAPQSRTSRSTLSAQGLSQTYSTPSSTEQESATQAFNQVLSVRSRFDEVVRYVDNILAIPVDVLKGRNQRPTPSEIALRQQTATQGNGTKLGKSRVSSLKMDDIKALDCTLRVLCAGNIAKVVTQLIEENSDELTPTDIDYLCTQSRLYLLSALNAVRTLQQDNEIQANALGQAPVTGVYIRCQKMAEAIRNIAHQVTQLSRATINQKPPLIIRTTEKTGTIHQQAHWIHGDYTRANELLRLNPHLRYPNVIEQGEVLNSYAK